MKKTKLLQLFAFGNKGTELLFNHDKDIPKPIEEPPEIPEVVPDEFLTEIPDEDFMDVPDESFFIEDDEPDTYPLDEPYDDIDDYSNVEASDMLHLESIPTDENLPERIIESEVLNNSTHVKASSRESNLSESEISEALTESISEASQTSESLTKSVSKVSQTSESFIESTSEASQTSESLIASTSETSQTHSSSAVNTQPIKTNKKLKPLPETISVKAPIKPHTVNKAKPKDDNYDTVAQAWITEHGFDIDKSKAFII